MAKAIWFTMKTRVERLARRRRIRSVSKVQARRLRIYRKLAEVWRADPANRLCRYPACARRADDIHHANGRTGRLLLDTRHWIPLCRGHHVWVGRNREAARKLGLLAKMGDWNRQ